MSKKHASDDERQAHLVAYALCWLRDNARCKADLFRIETFGHLWATLKTDLVAVLTRFGVRPGAAEDLVAEAASQALGNLAASAIKKVGLGLFDRIRAEGKRR